MLLPMESQNPECVVALGNVQTAGDQIKFLPRFCRLKDLPKVPGLFLPSSAPNREKMAQQRDACHGKYWRILVCGRSHDAEKK